MKRRERCDAVAQRVKRVAVFFAHGLRKRGVRKEGVRSESDTG